MKISYNWIKELSGVDWLVDDLAERLTLCGTACEEIEPMAEHLDKVVVGKVIKLSPIKGADKIQLATVDVGGETMDLVCGAPNVAEGQTVPVALLGAKLAGGMEIKKVKIRGVTSCGMICSERELGLSEDHAGIMVLDTDASLGTPLAEALSFDDYRLTFELTPNRPDSMCAIGIARDLAALANTRVRYPEIKLTQSSAKTSGEVSVVIEDPDACPRYAARVIKGVSVGESPWWMQQRLLMSGIRPISSIVDITNYVMLETGHPLHAFDLDRFGSREVVVRRAKPGETFTTLDDKEHELTPDVLLITNGKEGVAAGGVMGGLNSEVSDDTANVLLEAAYFSPSVIRKSKRHLGLATESSARFERGADPNGGLERAIDRAAALMAELCGGEVLQGVVDCYPEKIMPVTVSIRPERCNRILGTAISSQRMQEIFKGLEFSVSNGKGPLQVTVPTFRPDIEREIDLVEEVARIEGFDAVPDAIYNLGPLYTPRHPVDMFQQELRQLMVGAGFDEILNHGLADTKDARVFYPDQPEVKLANYSSGDLNIMRTSLMPTTAEVVAHNLAHRNLDLRLFEIGNVYFPVANEDDPTGGQRLRLAIAVTGNTEHTWRDRPRPLDFYDITGALEELCDRLGLGELTFKDSPKEFFQPEVGFEVFIDDKPVGIIGELGSRALKHFGIKQPVYMAELEAEKIMDLRRPLAEYTPLPVYPSAPRDLAIVVDTGVRAGELIAAIKETAGELAEHVGLFDLYTGKQIQEGRKSIAVTIRYRSPERSLSSEEVDERQANVVNMLNRKFNAEIRDK
jgi:phenylalanyl-tRNA synthetase beta chain